jgi:protein SMG6
MIAIRPFETARESVLPLWSQASQARRSAPDARAPELFVLLHGMLFTNIQLDDFAPILARLLERLGIEEPEGREWTMMAVINIGALLEYGRPQGVLRRTGVLGPQDRTPIVVPAAGKVKLARKPQADERMDVDGDEHKRSSDVEAPNPRISPVLSDASASTEPPPAFKMAQELTFKMLAHALRSTRDVPNPYVTILLTFLQTILRHPEGLATFERAIPWADLAAFLTRGRPHVPSTSTQSEKLGKSSIMMEDWAIRGLAWPGRIFERGSWEGHDGSLMEMEMLDTHDPPSETLDVMWEDDDEKNDKPRSILAWRRVIWASTKIAKVALGFRWDERGVWWIDGPLEAKTRVWEEEDRQAREEEERRKLGTRWVDVDGDELMDVEEGLVDNLSESGSEDDENDPEEIKVLKV